MSDALVLGFDTSGPACAAALLSGGTVVAHRHEAMAKGQAERLLPMLEEVLAEANVAWSDLAALGVGVGPGNFTGVRIAVSAARGVSLGLGLPTVGVSALEAQAFATSGIVISSLDARRDQLYLQVFEGSVAGDPLLCDLQTLPEVAHPICIGARADEIAARVGGQVAEPAHPMSVAIAEIARMRMYDAPARPKPLYLRAADAAPPREAPPVLLD